MVAKIAFLAIESHSIDEFLDTCLNIMGKTLDVSRAYFFHYTLEEKSMTNTQEWVADGITPEKDNLQQIPETVLPWWTEQMKRGNIINFQNIEDIPGTNEKSILSGQGIKSILVVPVTVDKRYYGFLGFDECRYQRQWAPEDVDILKTAGALIEKYVESKNIEQSLRYSEEKYRRVVEKLNEGINISWPKDAVRESSVSKNVRCFSRCFSSTRCL